ncbi:hypothetical protein [Streptomyces sp. NPDC048669]|uniref:hypothetical protein n=1 Tax=Streptomyces sp. NPDC048669 TaxID=3155267 RepID=UPI003436EF89
MNTLQTQKALFKLYMNPGYRLAYQIDKDEFIRRCNLEEEGASFLASLSGEEIQDFAETLELKQFVSFSSMFPVTFSLLGEERKFVVYEFLETRQFGATDSQQSRARAFIQYIHEATPFHHFPEGISAVAQLELMFLEMTWSRDSRQYTAGGAHHFSESNLYWRPKTTLLGSFAVDPLPLISRKYDLEQAPGARTHLLVAPAPEGRSRPRVLKLAPPALKVLKHLGEPDTGGEMCRELTSSGSLPRATLSELMDNLVGLDVVAWHPGPETAQ